jgi:hypothetical protein
MIPFSCPDLHSLVESSYIWIWSMITHNGSTAAIVSVARLSVILERITWKKVICSRIVDDRY